MKCEHCGRNEATFHYRASMNGCEQQAHLCEDCARRLGFQNRLTDCDFADAFAGFDSVFSLLPSMMGSFFEEPELVPVRRSVRLAPAPDEPLYETESLLSEEEGRALRRERERNELQARLDIAVADEDYEQAAKLRDELRGF